MSQIDITLKSRADPSGIEAMQRGLSGFQRELQHAGTEWESFGKRLAKKFSGADFGKEVLTGLGIGSGFAIAEKLAGLVEEHFKKAADAAREIEAYSERGLKATRELIKLRQTPEQQLDTLRNEQAQLEREKRDLETTRFRTVSRTTSLHGERETRTSLVPIPLTEDQQKRLRELPALINEVGKEVERATQPFQTAKINNALTDFFQSLDDKAENTREVTEKNLEAMLAAAKKFGPDMAALHEVTPDQEAAAADAAKRAIQEMNDEAGKDAIRKAREEIEKFDIAISQLDANPALSDQEKFKLRVDLLNQQTAAIQRLKSELEAFAAAHPGTDVAALTSAVDQLAKQGALNEGKVQPQQSLGQRDAIGLRDLSDPSKHYQSAGAGFIGGLSQEIEQLGTTGDRVAQTLKTTIGGAFQSIGQHLTNVIVGTETWRGGLAAIGTTILTDVVGGIVRMAVSWIEQQLLMAVFGKALGAASVAAMIPMSAAAAVIWAPAATLATIATLGGAAAAAPLEIFASQAAVMASSIAGFADGGIVGGGQQLIRVNERGTEAVLNARATAMIGHEMINAWNGGNYLSRPGYVPNVSGGGGGGESGGSFPSQIALIDHRNQSLIEQLERDPRGRAYIVRVMNENRHTLGVRA